MRSRSKAEKDHLDRVASLGCLICMAPAEVHHVTNGTMGKKSSDYDAIPLCPLHHRLGDYGVAFHSGKKAWEEKFGTQGELLEIVRQRLEMKTPP